MNGVFLPKHKEKYKGDYSNIIYRSQYELTFMMWCDKNDNILEWSSEEVIIPYRSVLDELREQKFKITKKKWHRYFVDFYIKVKSKNGNIEKYLIEVKPFHETMEPLVEGTKKSKKTIINQQRTWLINQAKWAAARDFCKKRNMQFKIITEKELYGRR